MMIHPELIALQRGLTSTLARSPHSRMLPAYTVSRWLEAHSERLILRRAICLAASYSADPKPGCFGDSPPGYSLVGWFVVGCFVGWPAAKSVFAATNCQGD